MSESEIGTVLMALAAILFPLWLAWMLLGRSGPRSAERRRPEPPPG